MKDPYFRRFTEDDVSDLCDELSRQLAEEIRLPEGQIECFSILLKGFSTLAKALSIGVESQIKANLLYVACAAMRWRAAL